MFALAVCAAVAVNGWLLNRNLQRMWEAERSPVSQISQTEVTEFPDFIIAITVLSSKSAPACVEYRQFISNHSMFDQLPCNMEPIVSAFGNHDFIITPRRKFLPNDPIFQSGIDIHYANISASNFDVCVMAPSQRDRYLHTPWNPFDACHDFARGDKNNYFFSLDASATEYPNKTVEYNFKLSEQFAGFNHSLIRFVNALMNPSLFWNKLTPDYHLVDLVSSNASVLSLTVAIFAFLFPSDNPQYRFRFRPPTRARKNHGLDAESGLARDDTADPLTMNDFEPAP